MATKIDGPKDPLMLFRPAPFWSWNDKLEEAELRRQIREMAEKGWGGFFMHSRVGLVTEYLSDEWMRLIRVCADEAQRTGLYAWLYDEDKWPSGFAGGIVPEKDERYRQKILVLRESGSAAENETVLASATHGSAQYDVCSRIVPKCAWFNGSGYIDILNPDTTREFLQCTHEKYKEACGDYFGKSILGIFTDEPCYSYTFFGVNEPSLPWSDLIPEVFLRKKGYDIASKLPALFFDIDDYRKMRFDFYDVISEMFRDSFTKPYYDWCESNNLILTGHFMFEDSLTVQTQWSGDVMSHYEFMHWPGVDKLLRSVDKICPPVFHMTLDPLVAVKQLTSVVDQLGKERALCETYGCAGGQVSFFHRKWIGDWQAALGINFVNHHLSLYSMRGERKRDCPPDISYHQPWWQDERGFADYQARLCSAVSEGERIVDILILQPLTSVWCEYSPLHERSGYAAEASYDESFSRLSRLLAAKKLDFHYGNENLMAKHARVEGDRLHIGRHSYNCVILPPAINLKSSTLELLNNYVRAGGRLIIVGELPSRIDGDTRKIILQEAHTVASVDDAVAVAECRSPRLLSVVDILTGKNAEAIYAHSRRCDNSVRYLLVNTDEKREIKTKVTLHYNPEAPAAVCDLCTGQSYALPLHQGSFEAVFAPAASMLIVSGPEALPASKDTAIALDSGVILNDLLKKPSECVIDEFECELMEDNVFPLDNFTLSLNGKQVYEGPVCGAWHTHFYPAADGTPFECTYTFHSECELDDCTAVIELAQNLESITFNSQSIRPMSAEDSESYWKDAHLTRVPLPTISEGLNVLEIAGIKKNNITGPGCHSRVSNWHDHRPTEAEQVMILGRFSLRRVGEGSYVISPFYIPTGRNLTEDGLPFYCGRTILRAEFEWQQTPGKRVFLRLFGASVASAGIIINDIACGTVRWPPYLVEITHALSNGINLLEIDAATTLVNAFGPNRRAGIKDVTGISQFTFMEMDHFTDRYELFPFGVQGASIHTL